jgi:hypothetical protein
MTYLCGRCIGVVGDDTTLSPLFVKASSRQALVLTKENAINIRVKQHGGAFDVQLAIPIFP